MSHDFTATIREESERAADWTAVFGGCTIPIVSPIPQWASAPGVPAGLFYQVDMEAITPEQRARLVHHIAHTFQIAETEVDATLNEVGCPILADDVSVTVSNPQKWI
jgi:hypothetical protein